MADERPPWITPFIFNDQPLRPERGDSPYFQFDNYARTFARIIASTDACTPLTIGIHGEWGCGKTTLMRAIRAGLDQTSGRERPGFVAPGETWPAEATFRTVKTVWFNAWKYSREEALFVALVEEVLREMRRDGAIARLHAALSDPKQTHVRVPEAVLSAISQVFSLGKIDLDLSRFESESRFKANLAFLDEFMEVFDRLVGWWVYGPAAGDEVDDRKGALAVFVDDLDRCMPDKTVQVLESIKLMMDRPGVVFVVGASRGVVQQAVEAHYKSFAGMRGEAERYLDKIIQVRFDLPPLPTAGRQSLDDFLGDLKAGERLLWGRNPTLVENLKRLAQGGVTNPRRIKTFVNYAELQWALLVNSGQAGQVNQDNFNCWLALTEVGGEEFRDWLAQLPEAERPQRIQEGIAYACRSRAGKAEEAELPLEPNLKQLIDSNRRLRGFLEQLDGFDVSPGELHLYIHLCAPPVEEVVQIPTVGGLARLAEERRAGAAGGEIEMDQFVRVPAGRFLMGSAAGDPDASDGEKPQRECEIPYEYAIGKYPVTNREFARFIAGDGYTNPAYWTEAGWAWKEQVQRTQPDHWEGAVEQKPDHPAVGVTWYEALAYCRWLTGYLREEAREDAGRPASAGIVPAEAGRAADLAVRLPTEAEWEKAARGEHGRRWPWGDEWDAGRCNSRESGISGTTPVGEYSPEGDSPYGVADMAGNVWEWCATKWVDDYRDYGETEDNGLEGDALRVLRGGSWDDGGRVARCAYRGRGNPGFRDPLSGFRALLQLS
jgi:formylglycine-generating enzyme required for sulfatase activity